MEYIMEPPWIPKSSCVDAMGGYMLAHGKHWKDSKSFSCKIPYGVLQGFPLDP